MFILLFANGTFVFVVGEYLLELIKILNDEFNKFCDCLRMNRLTINVTKTHYIVFHRARIESNLDVFNVNLIF